MDCDQCGKTKLSKEFPNKLISEECDDHAPSWCLRCLCTQLKLKLACPLCGASVTKERLEDFERSFRVNLVVFPAFEQKESLESTIYITLLDGNSFKINIDLNSTVAILKEAISKESKIPPKKQSLNYLQTILEDDQRTLKSYNLKYSATLQLAILMYTIASDLKVTFDLSWGYPSTNNRDYLDGSCLLFDQKGSHLVNIDWKQRSLEKWPGVTHTGDKMDDSCERGNQQIDLDLSLIPKSVHSLFFTLSAYHVNTIGAYQEPSVKLVETSNTTVTLCSQNFDSCSTEQAVIMCQLFRGIENWHLRETNRFSKGNAKDYEPLIQSCRTYLKN